MFCDLNPESTYVGKNSYHVLFCKNDIKVAHFSVFGGVAFTVVLLFCMVPVEILRSKLKKRHRELTEPLGLYNSQHSLSPFNQGQQRYEMYQQEQNEMLRRQVMQNYQQYPPPQHQDYYHQLQQHQPQQWQYYPASQNVQY